MIRISKKKGKIKGLKYTVLLPQCYKTSTLNNIYLLLLQLDLFTKISTDNYQFNTGNDDTQNNFRTNHKEK